MNINSLKIYYITMFIGFLLTPAIVKSQSAEPDSIYFADGTVIIARIIGIEGQYLRILKSDKQKRTIRIDQIEKMVNASGRIIYWHNRIPFEKYDKQKNFEFGVTFSSHSNLANESDKWSQLTPRISWEKTPGFVIELSGGRRTINHRHNFGGGQKATRNFLQIHIIGELNDPNELTIAYARLGFGPHWLTNHGDHSDGTFFHSDERNGYLLDAGFGWRSNISKQYRVRAELSFEVWFTEFAGWALTIGISRRILL